VQQGDDLLLHGRFQIHEEVAAGDEVESREGRVGEQVLLGEDHGLAQLLVHPVRVLLLHEEPAQAAGGDVGRDALRVDPGARDVERITVGVRGEDLEGAALLRSLQPLDQEDRDRVRLLPRRAARHPDPQRLARRFRIHDARNDLVLEELPGRPIAKEARDADQQVLRERLHLVGIAAQQAQVLGHSSDVAEAHAALDPAPERPLLVAGEVEP
jgi:hypothetical protein